MFNKFIAIPFKNGGRGYSGCDCYGLCKLIMKDIYSIDIPDFKISCLDSVMINSTVKKEQKKNKWCRINRPKTPCIILFRLHKLKIINHIGVYIGDNKFLHTIKGQGATITKLDHVFFKTRIEGFYEFTC